MGCHPSHWLIFFRGVETTNQSQFYGLRLGGHGGLHLGWTSSASDSPEVLGGVRPRFRTWRNPQGFGLILCHVNNISRYIQIIIRDTSDMHIISCHVCNIMKKQPVETDVCTHSSCWLSTCFISILARWLSESTSTLFLGNLNHQPCWSICVLHCQFFWCFTWRFPKLGVPQNHGIQY